MSYENKINAQIIANENRKKELEKEYNEIKGRIEELTIINLNLCRILKQEKQEKEGF